jgi:hypothetical protein
MSPNQPLLLSAAVFFCACISLPDIEEPQGPPDPPSLTVALAAPSGNTYTNGAISVQLQLQGDTPEQVELLVDGQPLTTLQAPYAFTWDTASVAEGAHQLSARARIADKTFSSEAREVIVDRTPPQVVSRTPAPGAQDVSVRQPIQATFSEPLKPGTVTSASVKLMVGGTETATSLSLSTDGRTLTVAPNSVLRAPNNLQITTMPGISDLAGNALSIPSEAWSWSLPISLTADSLSSVTGATNAEQPFLQHDSQGRMFVVWREQVASNKFNVYTYRQTNNAWEPVGGAVNEAPYTTSSAFVTPLLHMLQLDSAENPVVSWIHQDGATPGIHFKRWLNGAWRAIGSPLNAYPTTLSLSLTFQLDTNDRPVVAWEQPDDSGSSRSFIHISKWTGQNWEALGGPLPVSTTGGISSPPVLVLDQAGNPTVAWVNFTSNPNTNGITVQHWNGSTWEVLGGPLLATPQSLYLARDPRLILDASGNPTIAWAESDGNVFNIHARRWTGTSWEPLGGTLSALPGNTSAGSPNLAMDTLGTIFIGWFEYTEDSATHVHLRRWNGSSWEAIGPPIPQSAPSQLSLGIGSSGIPYIAWSEGDSSTSTPATIRIHRYNY